MKTYCPECGTGSRYNGKRPNFCYSCGYAFTSAATEAQPIQNLPEELPEEKPESSIPLNVNKLEVDIDTTFDAARVYKLGDVIGTANPDEEQQLDDNFIPAEQTKEQILNAIQKESKTLRRKN